MSKFTHGLIHVLAIAVQLVNLSAVPSHYQPVVAAVVGLIQGVVALSQHGS